MIDTTTPTIPVGDGVSNYTWASTNQTRKVQTESTSPSGIAKYQYYISKSNEQLTGGEWKDGSSVTISSEGLYFVFFRAINNAGTTSNNSTPNSVAIDKTNSTISISNTSGKFTITVSDISFHYFDYEIYLGETLKSKGSNSTSNTFQYTYSGTGTWKVYVRAFDFVGHTQSQSPNQNGWYYQTFNIK